jgi:hypothetical protein
MKQLELNNGVKMPMQMMGTSVWDYKGDKRTLQEKMNKSIRYCVENHIAGLDTGRDYDNESLLGEIFDQLLASGRCNRNDIFITTKVGNNQQRSRRMKDEIDISLKALRLEYVDLWLLHWPLPDYWMDNWKQLCEILSDCRVLLVNGIGDTPCDVLTASGITVCEIEGLIEDALGAVHRGEELRMPRRTRVCCKRSESGDGGGEGCGYDSFMLNRNISMKGTEL